MKKFSLSFIIVFILVSCTKPVKYDYQTNLESLVKRTSGYDLKKNSSKAIVLILQNEDCICTAQDIALSKSLLQSSKYKPYHFIIILSSMKHKFLKEIPSEDVGRINIIINSNNLLINHGYIAVTDQVIIYKNGTSTYFADMHITKPNQISNQIL